MNGRADWAAPSMGGSPRPRSGSWTKLPRAGGGRTCSGRRSPCSMPTCFGAPAVHGTNGSSRGPDTSWRPRTASWRSTESGKVRIPFRAIRTERESVQKPVTNVHFSKHPPQLGGSGRTYLTATAESVPRVKPAPFGRHYAVEIPARRGCFKVGQRILPAHDASGLEPNGPGSSGRRPVRKSPSAWGRLEARIVGR